MNIDSDLVTEFIQHAKLQTSLSPLTIESYWRDIFDFQKFCSAKENSIITPHRILSYVTYMRQTRELKTSTVRRRLFTLKKYCKWRSKSEKLENPFNGLELDLRIPKRLPRPVDNTSLKTILSQITGSDTPKIILSDEVTNLAIQLLLVTGLRISELTNLCRQDINIEQGRIKVIGKGNRERTVYVTNQVLLRQLEKHLCLANGHPTDPIFLNSRGSKLTPPAFRKRLRKICSDLDLAKRVTPHQFRHSAATLLIESGVDIRIVQRLLGHASITTTELYTEVSDVTLIAALKSADTLSGLTSQLR